MTERALRRSAWTLAAGWLLLVSWPAVGSAHGVAADRFSTPLPLWLLLAGAGGTVGLTALALGMAGDREWGPVSTPTVSVPARTADGARAVLGGAFALGVVVAVGVGLTGRQVAAENLATVVVWPLWFRGLALLAVLVGSLWPLLSPWRALYDGLCRLEGADVALAGPLPDRVGVWPALVGFVLLFGVVERLTTVPESPALTAAVVAAYGLVTVGGAVVFGRSWLDRADPLAVFYRLLGRVAPVTVERTPETVSVSLRAPWRGCCRAVGGGGAVVFAVAAVYTVSFDGLTNTRSYRDLLGSVQSVLGVGPQGPLSLYLGGLVGFVAVFVVAAVLVDRVGDGGDWQAATRSLAPTLVPIAAAYEVAHNYPYVLRNLGQVVGLSTPLPAADPLSWLPLSAFWASQVVLIVLGHLLAVVAGDAVTRRRYGRRAGRAHVPLALALVGYTVVSLLLVSLPVVA